MKIIEEGIGPGWQEREKFSIAKHIADGANLTNATEGGDGASGIPVSEERKIKLRASMCGRMFTPEWREKISKAKKGVLTPAMAIQIDRLRRLASSRQRSAEENEKRASALRGRKRPSAVIEKTRTANTGKKRTIEQRQRMSVAQSERTRGREWSEDSKKRQSEKRRGMVFSESHRANIARAVKLSNQRRRRDACGMFLPGMEPMP